MLLLWPFCSWFVDGRTFCWLLSSVQTVAMKFGSWLICDRFMALNPDNGANFWKELLPGSVALAQLTQFSFFYWLFI